MKSQPNGLLCVACQFHVIVPGGDPCAAGVKLIPQARLPDPDRDPRDSWLDTVKDRLRSDLAAFRADVEGDHDDIEEWDFLDGRVFASVGSFDDESNPNSGHGWMCRLVDSGALAAAGFVRVRKSSLLPS